MEKFNSVLKIPKLTSLMMLLFGGMILHAQTYNVAYNTINFGGTGVTISNKVGTGTSVNNIVLYQNVITIGGQQIDAIIRTQELNNVTSFSTYDYTGTSNAANNLPSFFSPQFSFGTGGGYAIFKIQFILGGSYNNTTNSGTLVNLQNIRLNTYDIDGNGTAGTNQYAEFGGFSVSELGNPTNLTTTYNSILALTKFRSTLSGNTADVTDVKNRVRVTYDYLSEFTTKVGAEGSGLAYYFLDFSAGATFTTAVTYSAPTLDLNTNTSGLDNVTNMLAPDVKNFTSGSSNIIYSGPTLDNLKVNITTAQILDGAYEKLLVNGATSGGTIALNFTDAQVISNVVLGGVTYAVTANVSGGKSILTFTKSGGGTLTVAQVENLLDALRYQNAATNATKAWRYFNVSTLAGSFETPVAQFQVNIDNVLPVELVSFAANCENENVVLNWETASEHNSASFILERSINGDNWEFRSEIEAAGNSNTLINYQFEDFNAQRFVGYYRLSQVDMDGKQKVYDPIYVECKAGQSDLSIYPNPTNEDFKIQVISSSNSDCTVDIVTTDGTSMLSQQISLFPGTNTLFVKAQTLNKGVFIVVMKYDNFIKTERLIIY